jgi:7-cyano-7-deazaguanine synthase
MSTIAVASGGMDSSTLCYYLQARGDLSGVVSIDYGQRHRRELGSAEQIAQNLKVPWTLIDLTALGALLTGSALTDWDVEVPHGHYAAENMKVTVVPNRNMILLAAAGGVAVAQGASKIATAVHAGDHFVYPDCRPEFIDGMSKTLKLATAGFGDIEVEAPFINNTKAEIAATGEALMVPWAETWTCYEGGHIHCGRCATCVERIEAFDLASVNDPTEYADSEYWRTVV